MMTTYRERFDQHVAEALSAVANRSAELSDQLPGLRAVQVRRLIESISKQLGYLDKGSIRHPEYLAYSPEIIPEFAIKQITNVPNSVASDLTHFVQSTLPSLILVEERLLKAVGIDGHRVKDIKHQQVIDLQRLTQESEAALDMIREALSNAAQASERAEAEMGVIIDRVNRSETSLGELNKIYVNASKLASGDARQNSLERIVRTAREKLEEIEAAQKTATDIQKAAETDAESVRTAAAATAAAVAGLKETGDKADEILRGATQAGLAGAYNTERNRLAKEQLRYAFVFYGGVVAIILYAAVFIVPVFSQIIQSNVDTRTQLGESALLLFVRVAILAPMVWALIFTNKRYSKLETLQMDYAAKAATALAYSGYKDEMGADKTLSNKLKDGLLVRFLEHPERLLNRTEMKEEVGISPEGVSYKSSNVPTPAAKQSPAEEEES